MVSSPTPRNHRSRHGLARPSCLRLWCALLLAAPLGAEELRVWTSSDGKTVTAALVSATDTTVTIKTEAGREFTFPHERLSQADRDVIQAHLAQKKAEYEDVAWPKPNGDDAVPAPLFRKLHAIDPKRFATIYAGRVLTIEGHVLDVKEDRMSSAQGVIVTLDTEDKVPVEFKFNKVGYEKDLTLLLGAPIGRNRGPYNEDEFRVKVADKSLVVERRYVVSREDYYYNASGTWRYRNKWSEWEVIAKPLERGESVKLRGEFVSVFNSIVTFKDARLVEPSSSPTRTVIRY